MAYLGFDPIALTALAVNLRRAADSLSGVVPSDPAASFAVAQVARAQATLRRWEHVATSLAVCGVLDRAGPTTLDVDLRHAELHRWQQLGLAVVPDPGTAPPADPEAVGSLLRTLTPSPDELRWLSTQLLRWARSDDDWIRFERSLTRSGLDRLLGELGRSALAGDLTAGAVLTSLGVGLGRHRSAGAFRGLLRRLPPDTAARLLERAGLSGASLADAAADVLTRWATTDWWVEGGIPRRNPADRVLAAVAADPEAAHWLVTDSDVPFEVLVFGPNDRRVPAAVWLAASSPADHDVAAAGVAVRRLLDELRAAPLTATETMVRATFDVSVRPTHAMRPEQRWLEARTWVGTVVAPWQPYLSGLAEEWGWTWREGLEALRWVAADAGAARRLAEGIGPSLDRVVARLPPDLAARQRTVDALGWSVGATDEVLRDAATDEVARERWMWSLLSMGMHRAAAFGVSALTGGAPTPVPQLAGVVASRATSAIVDRLDGDEAGAIRGIELAALDRRQVGAAALVASLAHHHRLAGRLDPSTPPPPVVARIDLEDPAAPDPLIEWIEAASATEEVRAELFLAARAVSGPGDRGRVAAG